MHSLGISPIALLVAQEVSMPTHTVMHMENSPPQMKRVLRVWTPPTMEGLMAGPRIHRVRDNLPHQRSGTPRNANPP